MTPEQTDQQLIESFRGGHGNAFNLLVGRYQQRVYWTARRILGNHQDADDIVQEVFIRVYRKLHTFREESSFYTWLYRITINLSLNSSRRRNLAKFLHLEDIATGVPSDADDPEKILVDREQNTLLDDAVRTLPEKQKVVFTMRYHESLKFNTIATILGKSVGGVKSNYFHALRKIDAYLKERNA